MCSSDLFTEILDAQEKHLIPSLRTDEERKTMIEVCGRLNKKVVDFFFFQRKKLPRNAKEYSDVIREYSWWQRSEIDSAFDGLESIQVPHGL